MAATGTYFVSEAAANFGYRCSDLPDKRCIRYIREREEERDEVTKLAILSFQVSRSGEKDRAGGKGS